MKRKITITLLLLVSILANSQEVKYINANVLNIRKGAGKDFNVITKASKNDKVTVISEQGNWAEIETESGEKGFVSSKYLSNSTTNNENSKIGDYPILTLIFAGLLLFVIFKIKKVLNGIFNFSSTKSSSPKRTSNSTKSSTQINPQKKTVLPKQVPIKVFMCSECSNVIRQVNSPKNTTTCHNKKFHKWVEIAKVGINNFCCLKCGITILAEEKPKNITSCGDNQFHRWEKL